MAGGHERGTVPPLRPFEDLLYRQWPSTNIHSWPRFTQCAATQWACGREAAPRRRDSRHKPVRPTGDSRGPYVAASRGRYPPFHSRTGRRDPHHYIGCHRAGCQHACRRQNHQTLPNHLALLLLQTHEKGQGCRFNVIFIPPQSQRSASSGSKCTARNAGSQQAAQATAAIRDATPAKIRGSVALTP